METPREAAKRIVRDVLIERAERGNRHALRELRGRDPLKAAAIEVLIEYRVQARLALSLQRSMPFSLLDASVA